MPELCSARGPPAEPSARPTQSPPALADPERNHNLNFSIVPDQAPQVAHLRAHIFRCITSTPGSKQNDKHQSEHFARFGRLQIKSSSLSGSSEMREHLRSRRCHEHWSLGIRDGYFPVNQPGRRGDACLYFTTRTEAGRVFAGISVARFYGT